MKDNEVIHINIDIHPNTSHEFIHLLFLWFLFFCIEITDDNWDIIIIICGLSTRPCPASVCVSMPSCIILLVRHWLGRGGSSEGVWTATTKMGISICWNIIEINSSSFWLKLQYFSLPLCVDVTTGVLIVSLLANSSCGSPFWASRS